MRSLRRLLALRLVRQLEHWVALAAILALLATVAVVFDGLDRLADEVDNTDRLLTRQTAQAAIASVTTRLRDVHQDYTNWDDAVRNLHGVPDEGFVDENLRGGTETGNLFDTAYLIDEKGNDLAAFHDGAALATPARIYFGPTLHRLVRDVEVDGVQTQLGFAATPDGVAAVAVGPVTPFTEEVRVPEGERRLFVIARHLTTERIESLRREFVIPGLTLVEASTSAPQGLSILDPRGEPVAAVTWTVRSPGRAALAQIGAKVWLALGFLSAAIGAILSVTWSNVRRTSVGKDAAEHAARHDFLTGLSNRAALVEILDSKRRFVSRDDAKVAILFFDLDGFKQVNDTHGHDAGDKLLQFCATKLVDLVAGRGLVARVGGDEFVILVSGPQSRDVADQLAQGIVELFNGPILIDRGLAKISASIGMAHRLGQEFSAMDLLKRADIAMYEAKKRGGNSVICYDRDIGVERKLELEHVGKTRAGAADAFSQHLAAQAGGRQAGATAIGDRTASA